MDIIILNAPAAADESERPRVFSHAGVAALERLIAFMGEDQTPFDVYAWFPLAEEEQRAAIVALGTRLRDFPGAAYLLLPALELSADLLALLEQHEVVNLILLSSGEPLVREAEALRSVRAHLDTRPDSALAFGAWVEDRDGADNFKRARLYQRAGISPEVVTAPPIARTRRAGAAIVPPELFEGIAKCSLYANALTIDAYGEVRLCPRDEEGSVVLGNLFTATPEDLVMEKGGRMSGVGTYGPCLTCDQRARFTWPERKSLRMEQLLSSGAQRGGAADDPFARLGVIAHRNLAAAGDDAVASDLSAFEERLQAWSETMKELDPSGPA